MVRGVAYRADSLKFVCSYTGRFILLDRAKTFGGLSILWSRCSQKESVEEFGSKLVSNSSGFFPDESEGNSKKSNWKYFQEVD